MEEAILKIKGEVLTAIAASTDAETLEQVRIHYLGRSGSIPALLEGMKDVPKEQRPVIGKLANDLKTSVAEAFTAKKETFTVSSSGGAVDETLPGRPLDQGSLHPVYQVRDEAIAIFRRLGFALAEGPDIETEFYNFDALNTPADHPARNEQDTFYLKTSGEGQGATGECTNLQSQFGRLLLRTQTSPVQIRTMQRQKPPIRIIAPGRCYRRDEIDATHGMSFHQMEGLVVDEKVTLADLKGTLEFFFRELLGADLEFRFRPHFFPFTEPSFEVDCKRPGQALKGREWLEICGCGMVHPKVLQSVGYDPEVYTGFAFGFGIERIAMQRYGIHDLRLFTENDVRFLKQF